MTEQQQKYTKSELKTIIQSNLQSKDVINPQTPNKKEFIVIWSCKPIPKDNDLEKIRISYSIYSLLCREVEMSGEFCFCLFVFLIIIYAV